MQDQLSKKFELSVANEPLTKSLKQVLGFIGSLLPVYPEIEQILFKSKIVVTELLTNAIKHSGPSETMLRVVFNNTSEVTIEKTDFGNRFNPGNKISRLKTTGENIVQLSKDSMHSIYAVKEENNFIKFVCEDRSDDNTPNVNAIEEHFGLLIITKAADEFTYHYDEQSGLNTFTTVLKLC